MNKRVMAGIIISFVSVALFFSVYFISLRLKQEKYTNTVFSIPDNVSDLPTINAEACYLFNPDDKRLMSGYSDYIAVAVVDRITGTTYSNVDVKADGTVTGTPYTNFEIKILKNIKGQLRSDIVIPLVEYGGVSIDGKYVECILPLLEEEKCYVLYIRSAENGSLYLNKAYQIPDTVLEKKTTGETIGIKDETAIQEYVDAYTNEDTQYAPSDRIVSIYDIEQFFKDKLTFHCY